ncbi:MAG: nucleotidyltransferase family protein [Candidatus Omnitrophica bacterium]|nr:nucleotidyltransferase family protein [Candidatus Omnitrophota bacterium]
MKALILAAGYATRLYPYTKNFPKPLLKVNDVPIIQYLVEKLDGLAGLSEILVVTNARFARNFEAWKRTLRTRSRVTVISDLTTTVEERLGAVGDMYFVLQRTGYDDDYLVLGGDNFFEEPLDGFVQHARRRRSSATIGVCDIRDRDEARNYGVVRLSGDKKITEFSEKPERPASSIVAMCLYYFPRRTTRFLKDYMSDETQHSDAAGAYIRWLTDCCTVYGFMFSRYWADIGSITTYQKLAHIVQGGKGR